MVYRVNRQQMGGGFGDQAKHPFGWGVLVYVDAQVARVYSARGLAREWTDLTRLEKWMREQGFWYWWMRNDLEPLHMLSADNDDEDANGNKLVAQDVAGSETEGIPERASEPETAPMPTHLFNLIPDTSEQT